MNEQNVEDLTNFRVLIFDYNLYKEIVQTNDYSNSVQNMKNFDNLFKGNYFRLNDQEKERYEITGIKESREERTSLGSFGFYVYSMLIDRARMNLPFTEDFKLKKFESFYENDGQSVRVDFSFFFRKNNDLLKKELKEATMKIESSLNENVSIASIYFDTEKLELVISIENTSFNFYYWYVTETHCNGVFMEIIRFLLNPSYSKYIDHADDFFEDQSKSKRLRSELEDDSITANKFQKTQVNELEAAGVHDYFNFDDIVSMYEHNNLHKDLYKESDKKSDKKYENVFEEIMDSGNVECDLFEPALEPTLTEEEYSKKKEEVLNDIKTHPHKNFRTMFKKIKKMPPTFSEENLNGECIVTGIKGLSKIMTMVDNGKKKEYCVSMDMHEILKKLGDLLRGQRVEDINDLISKIKNIK